MRYLLVIMTVIACTPSNVPNAPDTGDASPCAVDEAITNGRMIRTNNGTPLVLPPCPDGGK